jgi:hypothetical protein
MIAGPRSLRLVRNLPRVVAAKRAHDLCPALRWMIDQPVLRLVFL